MNTYECYGGLRGGGGSPVQANFFESVLKRSGHIIIRAFGRNTIFFDLVPRGGWLAIDPISRGGRPHLIFVPH